jgi:5-aminopentanamidase
MRVGYFQFTPVFGAVRENVAAVCHALDQSAAQLIVLPELFNTGYLFTSKNEVRDLSEPVPEGVTSQALMDLAKRKQMLIIAGIAEVYEGRYYNAAALFGPEGHLMTYRKLHLFQDEKDWFAEGNLPFRVITLGDATLGMMICFDWIFPEACRTLALLGAEIICHPSNLVLPLCPTAMVTRCIENRVFAITANRTGFEERGEKRLSYIGQSQIVDPSGKVLVSSGSEETAMCEVEIEPGLARNKKILERNHIFYDRRPAFYGL